MHLGRKFTSQLRRVTLSTRSTSSLYCQGSKVAILVRTVAGLCILSTRLYDLPASTSENQSQEVVVTWAAILGPLPILPLDDHHKRRLYLDREDKPIAPNCWLFPGTGHSQLSALANIAHICSP